MREKVLLEVLMVIVVVCASLTLPLLVEMVGPLQGCRVPAVEGLLLSQTTPKKIILVLNKIDLVPADVVRQVGPPSVGGGGGFRCAALWLCFALRSGWG